MRSWAPALLALILGAGHAPELDAHEPASRQIVDRASKGWPVAAFTLVDHQGVRLGRDQLLDRWTFVLFGDTRCLERCAPAFTALMALSKRIGAAEAIRNTRVLFVSLDPLRDTPARLKAFLAPYDERWLAATGAAESLAQLADDLGAVRRGPGGSVVLIGPDGAINAEYLPPYDYLQITSDFMRTRACGGCVPAARPAN